MTSVFFNSSSNNHSPYPSDYFEDHLNNHQFLSPNYQASSSSNSHTTHLFLNPNDQNGFLNRELPPPQHDQHEGDKFGSQLYKDHQMETNKEKGVKVSTWNKTGINNMNNDLNQVKWMSSKMRVMLKMKKSDHVNPNSYTSATREVKKVEVHKLQTSPMEVSYNSSHSTSPDNNNIPIRVCSDCNTTKTPLWRSGPRGPKSLCNACGIRQRKARRALMAAAAAAENSNNNVFIDQSAIRPKVTKTLHKDHKIKPHKGQVTKYKKRQYSYKQITPPSSPLPSPSPSSSSSPMRKNCVEEFLVRLSKNLTFYHVFPQDEKEAAILLMALSCGYAHET